MNPEDELVACVNQIEAMVRDARIFMQNKQYPHLNTLLCRIERAAREGTYCILDIADMV